MTYLAINICNLEWWHVGLALLLPFILGYLLAFAIWSKYKKLKLDLEDDLKKLKKKIADLEAELDACKHKKVDLDSEIALLKGQLREKNLEISTLEASLAANRESAPKSPDVNEGTAFATGAIASSFVGGGKEEPKDDLKKIEGIGPKIEGLLNDAGIFTFSKLANTPLTIIQSVLDNAGPRYRISDPGTWPEQAKLAADGKWDELQVLQDNLKGGRKA